MNLVGEGALVTGVLPDVFPVISVENLATDGWALASWRPAWGGASITGVAGQRPHVQISNPAGSGQIAVVEAVMMTTDTSGVLGFNIHDALLTTVQTSMRWRDRRFPTLNFPTIQIRSQSIAGTPIVSVMQLNVLASSPFLWEPPQGVLVLAPGTAVAFNHVTNATNLKVNFFWRERPADASELNL